ncbi:hypothetical protein MG293_003221 [Ovis ammon polii]|uniref:Uncharacterized protein n=1 Tax=Ovis ammon polii TaxID=230172 RepID=A0AAD4UIL9_OVIAM|nr:hypothetical protein MG293_003221 [Ovis ammon polii]
MQKSLFEEYKLTAAEILYELEEILQKYAVYNITFPVGIVNLVDYSWHDLTADAYKYATKNPMLKKHRAFQDDTSIMTMIDLKGYEINSCSREEYHKRNCLVKVKEDHHDAASKPMVKTSLLDQKQCSQISQDSSLPVVTHFSLTSKICLENGYYIKQFIDRCLRKSLFLHQGERANKWSFHDVNTVSEEARKLFKAYKAKCKQMKCITQNKGPSGLTDSVDIATFDPVMDISPMSDVVAVIKLRGLQIKAKHILLQWLNHYRFALGLETRHICKMPKFPQKAVRRITTAKFPLKQSTKESNENKEYLRYQNTFLKLKGMFKPLPVRQIQKTPASSPPFRLPLPIENKDAWFASQLVCPVVLRWTLCGKERSKCQCSTYHIPEVTDLEYDHLIFDQLSSVDQIVIVYVFSAKKKDKTMKEMAKLYRKLNRHRSMPCIQCRSDAFRLMKYNVITASKFTSSKSPLLVQRHNVIPGIFLMYIQGKLLFANFIFNGYGTSAKDLQKQTVKTRSDYHMGYFLPNDFRIR